MLNKTLCFTKFILTVFSSPRKKQLNQTKMKAGFLVLICLCAAFSITVNAQTTTVSGTISEIDGSGLPGVNIIEKGTTNKVITDRKGQYQITVSPDAALVFSSIDHNGEVIVIGGQTTIDLVKVESLEELSDVVGIGYDTLRKEAVTGSIASMQGEEMCDVPSSDITQALQGRIAGVEMSQTNSKPGASMQIRIRGTRSLITTNDPLIVLNGIPFGGVINDIDPNAIERIDILKDASATAIYGSRGANGVLLISTNKGQKNVKAQVSYNTYSGIKKAIKYPMMNGPELVALRDIAGLFPNGMDEFDSINTDWQDLLYRNALVTNHDLEITGGGKRNSYYFGLGYYLDQSPIPTQQFTCISLRGGLDQQIGKYITLGFSSNNSYFRNKGEQIGLYTVLSMSPLATPYYDDGTRKRTVSMALDELYLITRNVIEDLEESWIGEKKGYASYNNLYGELKIPGIEGLKYRANLGLNLRHEFTGTFTGEGVNSSYAYNPSTADITKDSIIYWVVENLLTYDRTFAKKHRLNLVALFATEKKEYFMSSVRARDISVAQYHDLAQTTGFNSPDVKALGSLHSWMGRISYSYDNRYMLMALLRADGSNLVTESRKWQTCPAASVGWNVGNEPFMQNVSFLDLLKLRVGYGRVSNLIDLPYQTLGELTSQQYNFGDDYATGYYVTGLLNDELGWEHSETYNFGVDFSIFRNRFLGTVAYYITNSENLLQQIYLPPESAIEFYYQNTGKSQNKGVEFSFNGTILEDFNGVTWNFGINLYHNKNTIVALLPGQTENLRDWWFVGYPINVIYDYEYDRLWQEDEMDEMNLYESSGNPGMIKVKYHGEYNEDGTPVRRISYEDRVPISVDPDFQGGFNTHLSYKGFDLTVVGAFKKGGILISTLHSASGYLNMESGRVNNVKIDYWTPENTDARYPLPGGVMSGDNPKYGGTLGYFDASYLKIRTITLGYSFDKLKWIKNRNIGKLRIYFTAQNPLVLFSSFHTETGLDPQTNSYATENAALTTTYQTRLLTVGTNTPATRNYFIGLNVTF